jgi:Protein of unknown function (DUF1638)
LRLKLQAQIDGAVGQGYDAVVLSYRLCGKATEGLKAKDVPLVIPRAHDCITLFLGSRERYQQEFEKNPGTYWFANDYIERGKRAGSTLTMGSVGPNSDTQALYEQYVAKYGKDNADYLIDVMGAWSKHYTVPYSSTWVWATRLSPSEKRGRMRKSAAGTLNASLEISSSFAGFSTATGKRISWSSRPAKRSQSATTNRLFVKHRDTHENAACIQE